MILDGNKKSIIDEIVKNERLSFGSLIESQEGLLIQERFSGQGIKFINGHQFSPNDNIFVITNIDKFKILYRNFSSVLINLTKLELVERDNSEASFSAMAVWVRENGTHVYNNQIYNDIKSTWGTAIISSELLENFVKNNYKTEQEIEFEQEKRDRKKAQKFTSIIAVLSIILSIVSTISSLASKNSPIKPIKVEIITKGEEK